MSSAVSRMESVQRQWDDWMMQDLEDTLDATTETEYRWHHKGLKLLRELLALSPDDPQLKTNLALTLRWLGQHEKVRMDNRSRAQQLLKEALTLKPDDPLIHYHLGWLAFKRGDRGTAEQHFESALTGTFLESRVRITALCNLAKLHIYRGDFNGAEQCIRDARAAVRSRQQNGQPVLDDWITMIEQVEADACMPAESCPYTLERSDGSRRALTYEDAMEIQGQRSVEPLTLFISQTNIQLKGRSGTVTFGEALATLCSRLMESRWGVSATDINQEVWPNASRTRVTTYIGRLRDHLDTCLGPSGRDAVTSIDDGYRWDRTVPWQIVRDFEQPY